MVTPVNIFDFAARNSIWLSVQQSAVAANVANANTPGYKSVKAPNFATALSNRSPEMMAVTNSRHMQASGSIQNIPLVPENNKSMTLSGNDVDVDKELSKGADITQQMQLNNSVVKIFNKLCLEVLK